MDRDDESVPDIRRTLELEPRHFGAICGFGQICLRHGNRAAALFAFDAALRINPHLGAVRTVFEELAAETGRTAH
jgi:cytochrome c-type biogenesis protein CcmH/NrfG